MIELNQRVASHLQLIAQLYLLEDQQKNKFRITTFQDAAKKIVAMDQSVDGVDLSALHGIGKSVVEEVSQLLSTGTTDRLAELGKKIPVEAMTMTRVEGIGPKTALKLHGEGIHNFDELVTAAHANDVRVSDRHIKNVLAAASKQNGRVPHYEASKLASQVCSRLYQYSYLRDSVYVCGSLRRRTMDSKDIDIVALATDREALLKEFCACGEVVNCGENKATIRINDAYQMNCDLWLVELWHLGAALIYTTGSKDHCVALRARAKSMGYTLNEYGIFKPGDAYTQENCLAGKSEAEVYQFLGVKHLEPEYRDGNLEEVT